ncbi:MAG: hypothetical protein AAGF90_21590, partial [Pseudomonadota bacterium]
MRQRVVVERRRIARCAAPAAGLAALALALSGCAEGSGGGGAGPGAQVQTASTSPRALVLDPGAFEARGVTIWDGRQTPSGVWLAHPLAKGVRRVRVTNLQTGFEIEGALFRRDPALTGPSILISSDAAAALGVDAGLPTELYVVALANPPRDEAVAEAAPAPTDAPAAETEQAAEETTDVAAAEAAPAAEPPAEPEALEPPDERIARAVERSAAASQDRTPTAPSQTAASRQNLFARPGAGRPNPAPAPEADAPAAVAARAEAEARPPAPPPPEDR